MTFVKFGISEPGFAHISSFRRQVYVSPADIPKIPKSLNIQYDDTSYWIYCSSSVSLSCFVCQQQGHIARQCPTLFKTDDGSTESQNKQNEIEVNDNNPDTPLPISPITNEEVPLTTNIFKRPRSGTTSEPSNSHSAILDPKIHTDSDSSLDLLQDNKYTAAQGKSRIKKKLRNPEKKRKQV